MRPADRIAPFAFEIYSRVIAANPHATLIYADDDVVDTAGRRSSPHFKPAWNRELFRHHDFVTGSAILKLNSTAELDDGCWETSLIQKALETGTAMHCPYVLHHRRVRPDPMRPEKIEAPSTGPSVTVIVPTRNGLDLLRNCVEGLRRTSYAPLDLIVVDNGSDEAATVEYLADLETQGVEVLRRPGPFNFSALNNQAADRAQGELLCFLNNDVEMIDPDWLSWLVKQAIDPATGAVGARLLYPDRTIQHAGVIIGVGGGAGHAHRLAPASQGGYFDRASLPQTVTAVTAACMVVAREKFRAVGGFDEADFPVAFNDVDLCLKLNAKGWQSFYEPRATLIHHESKSRGFDRDKVGRSRLAKELAALKRKWRTDQLRDPYHHINLSPFTEQFVIAV